MFTWEGAGKEAYNFNSINFDNSFKLRTPLLMLFVYYKK